MSVQGIEINTYYELYTQCKLERDLLKQELQKTREHLEKADELLREVELLIRYDANKPSYENPNKFILDHVRSTEGFSEKNT